MYCQLLLFSRSNSDDYYLGKLLPGDGRPILDYVHIDAVSDLLYMVRGERVEISKTRKVDSPSKCRVGWVWMMVKRFGVKGHSPK